MGRHSASDDDVIEPAERESPFAKLLAAPHLSPAAGPVEDELATVRLSDIGAAVPPTAEPDVDVRAEPDVGGPAEPDEPAVASGEPSAGQAAASGDSPSASGPPSVPAAERTGQQPSGTRGDLQLLRESSVLRLRCAAAVVVPFLVYTVLLIVIGRTDVYLIWFWIPTVLAGVLIGAFLDSAHRRRARREQANASGE